MFCSSVPMPSRRIEESCVGRIVVKATFTSQGHERYTTGGQEYVKVPGRVMNEIINTCMLDDRTRNSGTIRRPGNSIFGVLRDKQFSFFDIPVPSRLFYALSFNSIGVSQFSSVPYAGSTISLRPATN